MTEPVAIIENIGKQYPRNPDAHGDYGVRDVLRRLVGRPARANRHRETFWAVRDVSFEAHAGEAIGVIGVNGSGKTTLLRLIAGTAQPDAGTVRCRGHLQAIINLNAGFKPRLSGIENVKTALSLRGFSGKEARQRLDEIVDFSEIGEFVEQPVITYSSGMVARLAFATCVSLDPQLMLVDEGLAVGDRGFRNKCLLKMAELKASGVAILFVSHGMGQIQNFCDRALWLHKGRPMAYGPSKDVARQYIEWTENQAVEKKKNQKRTQEDVAQGPTDNYRADALHGDFHHLTDIIDEPRCRINALEDELAVIRPFESMVVNYSFTLYRSIQDVTIVIKIHRQDGLLLARLSSHDDGNGELGVIGPGQVRGRMELAEVNLAPGTYVLIAEICTGSRAFLYRGIIGEFHVRQVVSYVNGLIDLRRTHTIETSVEAAEPEHDKNYVKAK